MKILMLTDKMNFGGAETHIISLARALSQRGHKIVVASSGGEGITRLKKEKIEHVYLPLNKKTPAAVIKSFFVLSGLIRSGNFDIIHSHARIPSCLVYGMAKRKGVCFVSTVHAKFSVNWLYTKISRWGTKSIAVAQDLKQYLCDEYSIVPENVCVIGNGIDTELFCPKEDTERLHSVKRNCPRIAFLSRLDTDCSLGAGLLCGVAERIYKHHGYFEIIIGGVGNDYLRIRELAKQTNRRLGFNCIRLVGGVQNVSDFMRSADIFVGVSRAALEAAFCGLSVVLCGNEGFFGRLECENLNLARQSNFCARSCEASSEDKLYEALDYYLKLELNQRKEAALRLRAILMPIFDIGKTAEQTESFYKDAMRQRPMKNTRVLLCGYYGFGNMGDDALIRSAIIRADQELSQTQVCALTRRGKRDSAVFGIRCVARKNPLCVLREIKRCRYFIIGGGTVLQMRTSRRSLIYYAGLLRLAKRMGADCRLWGNGIGELHGRAMCRFVAKALSGCSYIGLRDESSYNTAEKLLGGEDRLHIEPDLAQCCDASDCERVDYLVNSIFGNIKHPCFFVIALNGSCAEQTGDLRKRLDELKSKGTELLFVVMHQREDKEISLDACREYGGKILLGICFSDLVGIIKKSEGVCSMRLHALIAASIAGVRIEGYGDDRKIRDFCRANKDARH